MYTSLFYTLCPFSVSCLIYVSCFIYVSCPIYVSQSFHSSSTAFVKISPAARASCPMSWIRT